MTSVTAAASPNVGAIAAAFAASLKVDFHDYLPFDTTGDARAALDALKPTALVFSKLDVWPAITREARERGVRLGMISATLLAVFLVPVFFVVVRKFFKGSERQRRMYSAHMAGEENKND